MTATAFHTARPTPLLAMLQPILLLAAVAFFAGFGGYLILGPNHVMRSVEPRQPAQVSSAAAAARLTASTASEPVAADDWNAPKKI